MDCPYQFNLDNPAGSTENNHRNPYKKSLSEAILTALGIEFNRRFEWADPLILEGLLELGELLEHNRNYTPTPPEKETYIAVKLLSGIKPEIFSGAFFCFPME